jgi:hypothetical protein
VAVGTVFTDQETDVLEAIDDYATNHSLTGRSAVVREALAHLLECMRFRYLVMSRPAR